MNSSPQSNNQLGRPLRVQFVLTSLPVGGAEVLLLNLLKGFDRTKIAAEVVCLKEPGELGEEISAIVPLHSRFTLGKWDPLVLPRLTRLMRSRSADAVVTVGAGDKMFWGRLAAWLAGVPVRCSALHSTGWPDGIGRLNRMLTPITSGFIACAQGQAEYLVGEERLPADRVRVIPNGIDTERFHPDRDCRHSLRRELGLTSDDRVVGIVAALRPEKNHRQFLEAASLLCDKSQRCHFAIIGDGPERTAIETWVRELDLERQVHLLGNRSDTPQILAGLDAFCLTSRNEAKPVSILEALACGVPVVAPAVGSIAESVIDGKTGFLTEPLSAESTASALNTLVCDTDLAATLGQHGRELVEQSASLQSMVQGYQDLLLTLYRGSPSSLHCKGREDLLDGSRTNSTNCVVLPSATDTQHDSSDASHCP